MRLCRITFEVTWRRRRDARPEPQKMYSVPAARAWWHAVGSQVDRVVSPRWRQSARRLGATVCDATLRSRFVLCWARGREH